MAKKATLTDVSPGYQSNGTLNNNFIALNDKFENTLSRDGSTPNNMEADLDMDSNDILNAKDGTFSGDLVVKGVNILENLTGIDAGTVAMIRNSFTGDGTTTTFTLTRTPAGQGSVVPRIDGVDQFISEWTLSGNSLIFTEAPHDGALIEVILFNEFEVIPDLTYLPSTPQDFGAVGDGVTDDSVAIKAWIEAGGQMFGPTGNYLVGGVVATLTKDMHAELMPGCKFISVTNLDNDMIRINADSTTVSGGTLVDIFVRGGFFDQTNQKNSTVIPFSANYPGANPGTTSTAEALSIRGEVSIGGTPTAGFNKVTLRDIVGVASSTGHWESAGGDSCIFVGGSVTVDVSYCKFTGARDQGIYLSGLTSGAIPNSSMVATYNTFVGCMFGATTKRLASNVVLAHNIGINTANVVSSVDVTTTGDNVLLAHNISKAGAWIVARATGGNAIKCVGNQSYRHGHLLEGDVVPTTVFNNNNSCVRMEGTQKSEASSNRIVDLNTGVTASSPAVRLDSDGTNDAQYTKVFNNTADGVSSVVIEDSGEADFNEYWDNRGRNMSGDDVVLDGASSLDRDSHLYENNGTTTQTGSTTNDLVDSATIKGGVIRKTDKIRIEIAGSITGTAGTKRFGLKLGGATQRNFPTFVAGDAGEFRIEATVEMNSLTSQRMSGMAIVNTSAAALHRNEGQDFNSDVVLGLYIQLGNAADSVAINTFTVSLEK